MSTAAAPATEADLDSPYIGAEAFDDEMTPEEQALYDAEMNESGEDFEVDADFVDADEQVSTPEEDAAELEAENPEPEPEVETPTDETEEGDVTAEESDVPHETQPDLRIPKARLDQEMAKRKHLEQELAELRAARKVEEATAEDTPIEVQFDTEAITRALDMNLDGKNSEAAAILVEQFRNAVTAGVQQGRSQMRAELDARTDQAVSRAVSQVSAQSTEQQYMDAVTEVESKYGVFNPEDPGFDGDLATKAVTLMNAFREEGATPAEALREAAELTLMRYRPELIRAAASAAPAAALTPRTTPTPESRARNAAAAAAQPPRQTGKTSTADDSRINLEGLTEEEFDALPDSVLAELRGDLV